ncbi:MAG: hypothetical protein H6P98_2340 [Candidatus Aminicenantes bacterium]|nr:hypothetical protein [Candidatus Aminicenantes bacterium]
MNFALTIVELHFPSPLKRRALRELFSATALAFGVETPPTGGLSHEQMLTAYALFTKAESEKLWAENGDQGAIEGRLFENARVLGAKLRRKFHVRSRDEAIRLSCVLYRCLGITFEGRPDGAINISECAFSRYYTGRVCRLISALDAGVAAGLSGGGRLEFSQRITEGHDSCRAHLLFKD